MPREILKVRRVGATLVVTLTQEILLHTKLVEGDRVLIEAIPPKRILITKEEVNVPNTRRIELEIEALEAKQRALESEITYKAYQHNNSMPTDPGMADNEVAMLILHGLGYERDKVAADLAGKRLDLFELQGA